MSSTLRPDNNVAAAQTRARLIFVAGATLGQILNFQPWTITTSAVLTRTAVTITTADVAPDASSMTVTALVNAVDLGARFWIDDVLWETTNSAIATATTLLVKRVTEWTPNSAGARVGQTGYIVKLPVAALIYAVYEGEKVKAPNGNLTVIKDALPGATALFFKDSVAITVASAVPITHSSFKAVIFTGTPTVPSRSFSTSSITLSNGTVVAVPNDASTSNFEFQTLEGDTGDGMGVVIAKDTKDGSNRLMSFYTISGNGEKKFGFAYMAGVVDTDISGAQGYAISMTPNSGVNRSPSVT